MTATVPASEVSAVFFDFDGVLTDNTVITDANGLESVRCNRSDGLAFDVLRKLNIPICIISTEANPVVSARGRKLGVEVVQNVKNKKTAVQDIIAERGFEFSRVMFVGNDINDYRAMECCGIKICPADSHPLIRSMADITLAARGGEGVAREIVEDVLGLDLLTILYPE